MALKKTSQKRPASSLSTQRYYKKPRHSSVVDALKEADLPTETRRMLCRAAKQSLSAFADERHECQQAVVEMSGEVLISIEKNLEAGVTAAHERIVSIDDDQLQAAVLQHARVRAELKKTLANQEAAFVEARMNFKRAEEAFNLVSKQRKVENVEYSELSAKKRTFDVMVQRLDAMKSERPNSRAIAKLEVDLKHFGVDPSIAATLHSVLVKLDSERGEFDALTMANLDAELASRAKEMEARLGVLEPAKAQCDATVSAAQAVHDAAVAQLDAVKASLSDAQRCLGAGEVRVTAAESDLKNMNKNLRLAQEGVKKAENRLVAFQSGPLHTFRELASCTRTPPPEPPAPEEVHTPA